MKNSQSPNRFPAVLLLVSVFGPPSVATLTFAHAVTRNPWLTVCLIALYEIIVLIVTIVNKIWQRLEDSWVMEVANWLNIKVKQLLSRYEHHYCQFLIYLHRDLDMKGLSTQGAYTLKLEHVFVNLNILPMPAHQISADPLNEPIFSDEQGVSIWDHLNSSSLKGQHFAIIGSPGSGKTTLLKYITLTLASHKKSINQQKVPHKLPVLLFLRDHVDALKNNVDFSLVDAVHDYLRKWDQTIPPEWIKQQLVKGRCLVLLDGLDEVSDPLMRRAMVEWVQRNLVTYGKNRFIISSRPYGYRDNPLNSVVVLNVSLFTQKQIERFVHNWYLANELMSAGGKVDPGVHMKAKAEAIDLLRRMYNKPVLLKLAINPLLLTMITTVHRYRGSLPGKRVALYDEICEVFLGKRQEARGMTLELTAAQKQQVLQPLAYYMMEQGIREIPSVRAQEILKEALANVSLDIQPADFLNIVENTSGILLEREQDICGFAHLTFQEYLAASYIKEQNLVHILATKVEIGWWLETIRLYCAQADATVLVDACLANDHPSVLSLILAMECSEEALILQPVTRIRLNALIDSGVEDTDRQRQHLVIRAVLSQRIDQMIYVGEGVYIDTSLVTQSEYQLFLDNLPTPKIYYPDHWLGLGGRFAKGCGRTPILGVRPSDAQGFCDWLTKQNSVWRYRLPRTGEIEKAAESKSVLDKLIKGTGYWMDGGKDFFWAKESRIVSESILQKLFIRDQDYNIASDLVQIIVSLRTGSKEDRNFINQILHSLQDNNLLSTPAPKLVQILNAAIGSTAIRKFSFDLASNLAHDYIHQLGNILNLDPFLNYGRKLSRNKELYLKKIFDYIAFFQNITTESYTVTNGGKYSRIVLPDHSSFDLIESKQKLMRMHIEDISNVLEMINRRIYSNKRVLLLLKSARFLNLVFVNDLLYLKNAIISFDQSQLFLEERKHLRNDAYKMLEYLIHNSLKTYVAFTLVEARILGQYAPCEGILLIKEQKRE